MSNWIGGLPPEPKAKEDGKKAKKPEKHVSPPDEDHQKTFYGGAIPPIPPKLPKYKKEDPPKVKITGAGPPIKEESPPEPKAPPPSPPATPRTPPPPPPPPPSPVSNPAPQSYSPSPLPKRLPSAFDKIPKKKRKKKKKKPPPPPPPPPKKPVESCDDDVCGDEDELDLGRLPSLFAISHIPATLRGQGLEDEYDGYGEKEDRSGHVSSRSGDDDNDGPDFPPEVLSYMQPDAFSRIFGKKIDARNIAELGPHGWHPMANAPYDITDTGDTIAVGLSGWHEPRGE